MKNGEFVMKKLIISENLCKGCGLCVEACSRGVLSLSERTNAMGYRVTECVAPDKCISCACCAVMCPDCVIQVHREVKA